MKFTPPINTILICISLSFYCCNSPKGSEPMDEETWKLGWRMIDNLRAENHSLADLQFDSLLSSNKPIDAIILMHGLRNKVQVSKREDIPKILANQPKRLLCDICEDPLTKDYQPCLGLPKEKVENKELQLELVKLFLDDQAIRGSKENRHIISKYGIDSTTIIKEGELKVDKKNRAQIHEIFEGYGFPDEQLQIIKNYIDNPESSKLTLNELTAKYDLGKERMRGACGVVVDKKNQARLKEIIKEFGFPTRELVGKDAMLGVYYIIQHADGDSRDWQKSQLPNLELAVKRGDLVKSNYAYLYDRIQVNHGLPQRYGTQFAWPDLNNVIKLHKVENIEELDQRRREMGIEPIEMYKKRMLGKN